MEARAAMLVAAIVDRIEDRPLSTGRPPMLTIKAGETLRFFVRESVQWRELRVTARRVCGSSLRRRLDDGSATTVPRRARAALIRMVRLGAGVSPWDVIVDR